MNTEKTVIEYLKDNPDFLNKNPDVLDNLELPEKATEGGVVDFQSMLLNKLKKDKSHAQRIHKELVENARENMSNQARIQTAILVALEAENFEEFVEVVTQDFPVLLNVDTVNVIIESTFTDSNASLPDSVIMKKLFKRPLRNECPKGFDIHLSGVI